MQPASSATATAPTPAALEAQVTAPAAAPPPAVGPPPTAASDAKADAAVHVGRHSQARQENLSDVSSDPGHDADPAPKDVDDGHGGYGGDLVSGSEDEDENFAIRAFPTQEAARASEQRLRQLKEAAKAAEVGSRMLS